ncbi:hypothetical protein DFQ28_001982 [Apophysomyces sp. BC1034]|nr:hypothetical protein DFQ29_001520 [Apophysomyces sp. BC1021]KAG0168186.1 hypothetical protein DFQ30_005115 [Apophysomyces sp. BC1015]KAG0182564.1 hypothetical protein DFQ28_001982 [Apophysomyces sp. BC1034]
MLDTTLNNLMLEIDQDPNSSEGENDIGDNHIIKTEDDENVVEDDSGYTEVRGGVLEKYCLSLQRQLVQKRFPEEYRRGTFWINSPSAFFTLQKNTTDQNILYYPRLLKHQSYNKKPHARRIVDLDSVQNCRKSTAALCTFVALYPNSSEASVAYGQIIEPHEPFQDVHVTQQYAIMRVNRVVVSGAIIPDYQKAWAEFGSSPFAIVVRTIHLRCAAQSMCQIQTVAEVLPSNNDTTGDDGTFEHILTYEHVTDDESSDDESTASENDRSEAPPAVASN